MTRKNSVVESQEVLELIQCLLVIDEGLTEEELDYVEAIADIVFDGGEKLSSKQVAKAEAIADRLNV